MSQDPEVDSIKLPPHSIPAEQSVLGGLLLDNSAMERIADVLGEDDFYRSDHKVIFRHIARLTDQGRPADVVTAAESMEAAAELAGSGGMAYLGQLVANTPSAANIRRYAEIVRERAILRKLAQVGTAIADSAYNPLGRSPERLLDEAESKVLEIAQAGKRTTQGFRRMPELVTEVVEHIDMLYNRDNPSDVTGVPTGFIDLDRMTSGLQPGDLVIIAGRPSMGKAQPLDAQVRTASGWTPLGELRLGDALASIDGRPSRVRGIFPQGERQLYRVRFSDGRSTECCAEHLWSLRAAAGGAPQVMSTAQLQALCLNAGGGRWRMDAAPGHFGNPIPVGSQPWILGCQLGRASRGLPGGFHDGGNRRVAGDALYPRVVGTSAVGLAVIATGEPLRIPTQWLLAAREARVPLLLGLLHGLGARQRGRCAALSCAQEDFARDLCELVRSLGGQARLNARSSGPGIRLRLRCTELAPIGGPVPGPLLASVTPTRCAQAACIAVTHPSRLYIADDYVVTHNTALALNIASNVALDAGLPVGVFSMEMASTQLVMRLLGSVGKLDQHRLRTGRLDDEDWPRLTHAVGRLNDAHLQIDDTGALNSFELRARARRLHREYQHLGLIMVDYLQLMSALGDGENRATEISEISRSLKALAKELKVPVVALSQLNRSLEQRPNKRPMMSDLRESGAIEQDADVILFIYRDEVYNPETPDKGIAEIIIGKQRNGPTGTVKLTFQGEYTRFDNYADPQRF